MIKMEILKNIDSNLMQMYIQQANVVVENYINNIEIVSTIGIVIILLGILGYKYLDDKELVLFIFSTSFALWFFLGICMTLVGGYESYCTAKLNPEYWAYKRMLMNSARILGGI